MNRSNFMLAALASATMPNASVAGVRGVSYPSTTDEAKGIDQAIVQEASGKLYDVYAADSKAGIDRLTRRYKAAQVLAEAREPNVLSFALDKAVAFSDGSDQSATAGTCVLMTTHNDGDARSLDLLTIDDCSAVGTTLGAIHRLNPSFLEEAKYPVYSTEQIHKQLTTWIERLRAAGHVPDEITNSWANIINTNGLWSFTTCPVHGGFDDGDLLFSGSTVTAVTNWQNMQVNDPARDLAWTFSRLDSQHRNAVIASYGRMLGSRLDDLIMLRANLWVQMEQVGDFIQALNVGDNDKIVQFRAQVERLATQLGVATNSTTVSSSSESNLAGSSNGKPETITVGTLLREGERRNAAAAAAAAQQAAAQQSDEQAYAADDATGSRDYVSYDYDDAGESDNTADRLPEESNDRYATITMKELLEREQESADGYDRYGNAIDNSDDNEAAEPDADQDDTATTLIPQQERDERAQRDALAGLEGYDDEGYAINE